MSAAVATARRRTVPATLRSSLRGQGPQVRRLAWWSTVQALPAYLTGVLVARAVDDGFLAGSSATGLAWLGLLGFSVLAGGIATRQTYLVLAKLVEPFRDVLVRDVVTGTLRRCSAADISPDTGSVARLTQQVEIVREAYAGVLMVTQAFVISASAALLGLLTLFPLTLVLVVPPLVLAMGLFVASLGRMAAAQRASILADERIAEGATAVAGSLRDVTASGAEDAVSQTMSEHVGAQADTTRRVARLQAGRTVIIAIGGWLPLVLILACGPWLVRQGASTGEILGALTYVAQGIHPTLERLVRGLGNLGLWLGVTLRRILDAIEELEVAPAESRAGRAWPAPARHDLRLLGATFAYGPWAEPVISRLDLAVPEGDHLAIVGPSGVGKSTLAGVLTGLLEPQEGDVRLGGVPLQELEPGALAAQRVLIPQEAYVFAGTLRENLGYLVDDPSDAVLEDAVGRLGLGALVERLGGLDAEVSAGTLSAGERQLITLARAYVSPARVVVLDEATCHLDPEAEARVEGLFAQRPGTLVVIAHRISSALRAQRVLLLDGARPLVGTHDELLAASGLYRDLVGHWDAAAPRARPAVGGAPASDVSSLLVHRSMRRPGPGRGGA